MDRVYADGDLVIVVIECRYRSSRLAGTVVECWPEGRCWVAVGCFRVLVFQSDLEEVA